MKSTGDPILDLQEICKQNPTDKATLEQAYHQLGWGVPFDVILSAAVGTYLVVGDDGLYYPRNGSVTEILSRVLSGDIK